MSSLKSYIFSENYKKQYLNIGQFLPNKSLKFFIILILFFAFSLIHKIIFDISDKNELKKNILKIEQYFKICNNYRNSKQISTVANKFVLKNKYQIKKKIKCHNSRFNAVIVGDEFQSLFGWFFVVFGFKIKKYASIFVVAGCVAAVDDI